MKIAKTLLSTLLAALVAACSLPAADTSISALPAISTVQSGTLIPVVDVSGTPTTKKATAAQLITGIPAASGVADGKMIAADKAKLDASTALATASTIMFRDSSGNSDVNILTANAVTGLANPVNASDAANKAYVDAAAVGLTVKSPAGAATTGSNITLSAGAPNVLDGVSLALNTRVLVKNQSDPKENGIYFVSTLGSGANGTWTRSTDADTGAELVQGSYIFISAGTTNSGSSWVMTTPNPITIGTSNIVWFLYNQITNVPASAITGQIISSQIANFAITTAQFASGLTPVEILGALPSAGNFAGRLVFLTTTAKLYRYTGSAFTAATPTTDLTGQIAAGQIAANAVTAGTIAANAVTTGTIQAGAVSTTELAVGGVTGTKIANGTISTSNIASGAIVASLISVANLSAINSDLGTINAGNVTIGTSTRQISISNSGLLISGGRINMSGDGVGSPWIRVFGSTSYASQRIEINGQNGSVGPFFQAINSGGSGTTTISPDGGITLNTVRLQNGAGDGWGPLYYDGSHDIQFQWDGGNLKVRIDQSTVKTITTF